MSLEHEIFDGAQRVLDSARTEPALSVLIGSLILGFAVVGVGMTVFVLCSACSNYFKSTQDIDTPFAIDGENCVEDPAEGPGGPTIKKKKARVATCDDDDDLPSDRESDVGESDEDGDNHGSSRV